MLDKIKGALFGLAIGDALGGTTEFLTKAEIARKYGTLKEIVGGGVWHLEKGETTDDTAMSLAVAKGIVENPEDPVAAIGEEFIKWYDTNPKDIGNIIRTVFSIFNGDWFAAAQKAHTQYLGGKSAGNGTLMRCLPVALAYRELQKVDEITRLQSKMTHFDGLADEACIIYNRIAFHVLHGKDLKEAIRDEVQGTAYESALTLEVPDCHPDGFVVNTMRWVLYWLLTSGSFEAVVIGTANEGYDTDTVSAIAGGLAGLACGFEQLPEDYVNGLLQRQEVERIAEALTNLVE